MNDVPNFTPNEVKALHLIAYYKETTVEQFCLDVILNSVFRHYLAIKDIANMPPGPTDDAKAWAMKFKFQLAPLIESFEFRKGGQ